MSKTKEISSILGTYFLIITIILTPIFVINMGGCENRNDALRILNEQGYTEIEFTGYRFFMAGKGDYYSTGFKAKTPNGNKITGAVTGGFFKGNTIRLD